jgi:hypothetical protein
VIEDLQSSVVFNHSIINQVFQLTDHPIPRSLETQRDEAATKTKTHRRERRGRRGTQKNKGRGISFGAKIVASREDFQD